METRFDPEVRSQVPRHFAAAGRVPHHVYRVLQIEFFEKLREIVGVRIHVIAVPRLVGAPVSPAVMGDDPIATLPEEQHLSVPVVRAERLSRRLNTIGCPFPQSL